MWLRSLKSLDGDGCFFKVVNPLKIMLPKRYNRTVTADFKVRFFMIKKLVSTKKKKNLTMHQIRALNHFIYTRTFSGIYWNNQFETHLRVKANFFRLAVQPLPTKSSINPSYKFKQICSYILLTGKSEGENQWQKALRKTIRNGERISHGMYCHDREVTPTKTPKHSLLARNWWKAINCAGAWRVE